MPPPPFTRSLRRTKRRRYARWQELRQQAIAGLEAYYHLATERDAYAAQKQLADANK